MLYVSSSSTESPGLDVTGMLVLPAHPMFGSLDTIVTARGTNTHHSHTTNTLCVICSLMHQYLS